MQRDQELHDSRLDDGRAATETDFARRRTKLGIANLERLFMREDDRRAKMPDFVWLRQMRIPTHYGEHITIKIMD
jgi:hypothetical protein